MSKAAAFGIGNKGEKEVIALLNKCGIVTEKEPDREKRYDHDLVCQLGKKKFTCEVKFDSMACQTGNLAIEWWNSKKDAPSGLTVTKANLWVHLIRDGSNIAVFIINTSKLRNFVNNTQAFKDIEKGGDNNASLKLFKLDDILPEFTRIDNLHTDDIKKQIKSIL